VHSDSADHLCPSCHQAVETVDHFLACLHPGCQQIWKELHELLYCHQIQNTVSNVFYEMIAYGLYQGHQAPTHLKFFHLPHDLHALYSAQEQLGWKQLYYGCLTPIWSELLQQYHPQINSIIYFAKIITLIWQAMLKVWKLHNDHLHLGNPEQEDHSQLQAAVHQIFFET